MQVWLSPQISQLRPGVPPFVVDATDVTVLVVLSGVVVVVADDVLTGGMVVVVVVIPPVGFTTETSAQFQNCSPQPECPFGPEGPLQVPAPTVHQAALLPVQ